eukprot:TRINITY_DN93433_c0_g1_i1.p1 TRINITY_DN93433_c0_g1~~TRINITY_DN93433_c0_g1_i1.p1  ORF type:complete len:250 (-),score=15.07 TRINITY_DN93433_c0_g1_i1:127-876(-)
MATLSQSGLCGGGMSAYNAKPGVVRGRLASRTEHEAVSGSLPKYSPNQGNVDGRCAGRHREEADGGSSHTYMGSQGRDEGLLAWRHGHGGVGGGSHMCKNKPKQGSVEDRPARLRQHMAVSGGSDRTAGPEMYDDLEQVVLQGECPNSAGGEIYRGFDLDAHQSDARRSSDGLPSVGSAEHFRGKCRPCAHFWRPASCTRGEFCERCHLCTKEDFKKYAQGRKDAQRARKATARLSKSFEMSAGRVVTI